MKAFVRRGFASAGRVGCPARLATASAHVTSIATCSPSTAVLWACGTSRHQGAGPPCCNRRRAALISLALLMATQLPADAEVQVGKVTVRPELTPDQSAYDPSDTQLRSAAQVLQDALAARTVEEEEATWTKLIEQYEKVDANWVPDLVGRAYGNRGNARARQGKLDAALRDYNQAMTICPWSVDPLLNRGAVLEQQGRFEAAEADYLSIIDVAPQDPAAWNNLGNTTLGMRRYRDAAEYFRKAAQLSPQFSFASANRCVALFAAGDKEQAIREMRALLRKYPELPDTRAALTAALWDVGKEGDAETQWQRVSDTRYKDAEWLKSGRRWPPELIDALSKFQSMKSVP